jgi:Ca-activated chloride channel homolog
MTSVARIALTFFCIGAAGLGFAQFAFADSVPVNELKGIMRNNSGVKAIEKQRSGEAYEKFVDALAADPYRAEIHFNLGFTFEANKEPEKAMKEYATALQMTKDPAVQFRALYNSGRLAGEMKNIDLALQYYQDALEIIPDSKEVKTNIELLLQQQQGGGNGEGEQNQQGKDQSEQGNGQQPKQYQQQGKQKPKSFKSDQLSQQDVNRILEELKRQEESVRDKFQREGAKDAPRDKDW